MTRPNYIKAVRMSADACPHPSYRLVCTRATGSNKGKEVGALEWMKSPKGKWEYVFIPSCDQRQALCFLREVVALMESAEEAAK